MGHGDWELPVPVPDKDEYLAICGKEGVPSKESLAFYVAIETGKVRVMGGSR
jgi:hypothetical protein